MEDPCIVLGQHTPEKREVARRLRRDMTPAEAVLWQKLRANRLDNRHFRRQQVVDGFIVDFYCHAARLVVEVDGAVHAMQLSYDEARDRIFTARGLRVLRFANTQVLTGLPSVLAAIRAACRQSSPPAPPGRGEG